jgi:hypothetical protein
MKLSAQNAVGMRTVSIRLPEFCIEGRQVTMRITGFRKAWTEEEIEKRRDETEDAFYRRLHPS